MRPHMMDHNNIDCTQCRELLEEAISLLKDVERRCDDAYGNAELNSSIYTIDEDDFYLATGLNRDLIHAFLEKMVLK